ncbi:nicotinate phosphoribosyltransferase [Pseudoglutamicibacter albus]|uniref:nicotinate phosphoribosyltransferase n=1 Tax=Pseudoglutamicibacter TaxID=1742991 RepID=UPI000C759008|nr:MULTISPECIES: nicotinate phosphoribosyltransferase [Pseudoglutamicibacter]MDK7082496.1 nicotinate phosphoribosyltransferase [Pseudoglutamicibacter cumminsii]PKY81106.1 nicotinate phosphoribosyltransferase [Pseudoglutamicibacter albus]WIK84242.1 nicotinate phosphoribosyltransferase [Pseudoglutamicibacter albus]
MSTSTSLMTDRYELTMIEAALASGTANRKSVFEVFARRLPEGRRYGLVAGTGRFLEGLKDFRFTTEDLDYLANNNVVGEKMLNWLADFRFSGTITGYAEGEIYFPNSPIIQVESTFAEAVILETYLLSVLNYDTAVASAASRMIAVAGDRPCIEMGSRRTNEESAVAAARAAAIAGFASTSNLEAGRRYGLTTAGTAAHSFTLLHDSEREAFEAQIKSMGVDTTLLVDTYDVEKAVRTAVEIAGPQLGGVRLDSGDLVSQAAWVRELLDDLGNPNTKIIVTSDLDEYAIAALRSAPVDGYGVGTQLVTGSGAPTASMVYKLVARQDNDGEWVPVAKSASGKKSVGGKKYAYRQINERGRATAELVGVNRIPADVTDNDRPLQIPLVVDGEIQPGLTGAAGVEAAIERRKASIEEMPGRARQLMRGEPVIPTLIEE